MTRISTATLVAVLTLTLAACSSSGTKTTSASSAPPSSSSAAPSSSIAPASTGPVITIKGFAFAGTLTVKPGAKVTVKNEDSAAHTLTDKKSHKFDTGNIAGSGGTGTFTAPTKPGKYPIGCTYHPNMAATLVVQG